MLWAQPSAPAGQLPRSAAHRPAGEGVTTPGEAPVLQPGDLLVFLTLGAWDSDTGVRHTRDPWREFPCRDRAQDGLCFPCGALAVS